MCALLGVIAASGVATPQKAAGLTLGRVVEPPPRVYADGPTQTGSTTEMQLPTVHDVDVWCRLAQGGLPQGARHGAYYMGCYDARFDLVVIMRPAAWPSRREWEDNRKHEWAHARGWRHYNTGQGTNWAMSLPPKTMAADSRVEMASVGEAADANASAAEMANVQPGLVVQLKSDQAASSSRLPEPLAR